MYPSAFRGPPTKQWDIEFGRLQAAAVAISAPPAGRNEQFQTELGPILRACIAQLSDAITDSMLTEWPERVRLGAGQINAAISVMHPPDTALSLQPDPGIVVPAGQVLRDNGIDKYPRLVLIQAYCRRGLLLPAPESA